MMSENNLKEKALEEDEIDLASGSREFIAVTRNTEPIEAVDEDYPHRMPTDCLEELSLGDLNSTDGSFGCDWESTACQVDDTHHVALAQTENLQITENSDDNGRHVDCDEDLTDENQNMRYATHNDSSEASISSHQDSEFSPIATLQNETDDHQIGSINPFDSNDCDESDANDVNLTKFGSASTNPFGDDEDDNQSETKEDKVAPAAKFVPISAKKPFNPFDDGEIEAVDSIDIDEVLQRRRKVTESLATVTLASIMDKGRSSSPPISHHEVPSKTYSKEYHELMTLGFDKVCVGNALHKASGDVAIAQKMLMSRLFDDHILTSDEMYVWKSPVMVRVGGWLPNVQDSSGATHTSFFINVTMTVGNESWRVGHRYSEFYKLYSGVYYQLCKSFPSNMKNPFPTDRISNWLSLANQETINDTRRNALDYWLKEVCNCPQMMLDLAAHKLIFAFLEVNENMAKVKKISPKKPVNVKLNPSEMSRAASTPEAANLCCKSSRLKSTSDTAAATELSRDTVRNNPPRGEGTATVSATDRSALNPSLISRNESTESINRRKAALAAQKNDYNYSLSKDSQTVLTKSEPSSSGFTDTDVRSKSFAKRVNPRN